MAQGHFVSGNSKHFGAKGRKLAVDVIIPSALAANFDVIEKAFLPDNITHPDGSQIIWFNNIGLQAKNNTAEVSDYYEIQISRASFKLKRFDQVYIYVNGQAQPLSPADFNLDVGGKVVLRLNLIDPAIGIGGG
jgi:hypothetical protein